MSTALVDNMKIDSRCNHTSQDYQVLHVECMSVREKIKIKFKTWFVQTFEMVKAGLHCSFKISRHMLPLLLIFG